MSIPIIPIIASFFVTLLVLPYWIKRAREHDFVAKDMHKKNALIPELGGIIVSGGIVASLFLYIAIEVFYNKNGNDTITIFAAIASILTATIIGLVDDLLGWKIGLRKYQKLILTAAIAVPIVVINAGDSTITLPFLGQINVGILYPLLLIPIGIIGCSNGFNIIAGYNGLEAGNGIIILSTLGFISYAIGASSAALIAFIAVAALIAFLVLNYFPAKVFPGNTMTYTIGSIIAIVAIFGNIEKFAIFVFIPYLIEGLLKARGLFQKESFATLNKKGYLEVPYQKFYSIQHIIIFISKKFKPNVSEKNVVVRSWIFQILFAAFALIVFYCQ